MCMQVKKQPLELDMELFQKLVLQEIKHHTLRVGGLTFITLAGPEV